MVELASAEALARLLAEADAALVHAVYSGDVTAAEELFARRLGPSILFLSRRFKHDDLLGDLYVHLCEGDWRRLRQWSGTGSLTGWATQVCIRLCYTQQRQRAKFVPLDPRAAETLPDASPDPFAATAARLDRETVLRGITALANARDRLILRSLIVEGRVAADVAKELGIARAHFYVLQGRAVARLRRRLELIRHE